MSALRQSLALTVAFVLVLIVSGLILRSVLDAGAKDLLDETLTDLTAEIQQMQSLDGLEITLELYSQQDPFNGEIAAFLAPDGQITGALKSEVFTQLGLRDLDGQSLFAQTTESALALINDLEFDLDHLSPEEMREIRQEAATQPWRVLVTSLENGRLAVAAPRDDIALLDQVLPPALGVTGLLMALVAMTGGIVFGVLAQRRITRMEQGLDQIASGDLTVRLAPKRPYDDLDHLALRIDHTTTQIDMLMTQAKSLSVSIAHDLRLPLARLRAGLEQAPQTDAVHAALEETDKLAEIFDTIMRIAGFQIRKSQGEFVPCDLGAIAREVFNTFEPVFEDSQQQFSLELDRPNQVLADRSALIQAMSNLVQNARVHTPSGSHISVFACANSIGVCDNGPGIPPKDRERVVQLMVRSDSARSTPGAGLGLALVKAVTDLHGAALTLGEAHKGSLEASSGTSGLRASIDFRSRVQRQ